VIKFASLQDINTSS